VLGNLNWKKCLCFLDDLIIFGADFDTALQNRREVFSINFLKYPQKPR
jgi:hypothetical protein